MPRTVLVHAHLTASDNDGRDVPELVTAVEETLRWAWSWGGYRLPGHKIEFEIIAAEILYGDGEHVD